MKTKYLSRAEFESALGKASALSGIARKRAMEELQGCTFIDDDEGGTETRVNIHDDVDYEADEALSAQQKKAIEDTVNELAKPRKDAIRPFTQKGLNTMNDSFEFKTLETSSYRDQAARYLGRRTPLNHFKGADAHDRANRWGMWALAVTGKSHKAAEWCQNNGLVVQKAGHNEYTDTVGGYTVPDQLDADLVDLRLEYGVFRRNARNSPMTSDHKKRNRRTGGLTAYFVGEGSSGTTSNKTWDQVTLTAKKLMVLSKITSELNEDSVVNLGDDLAGEAAYAFAYQEDLCGFTGDGTSTYAGIVGVSNGLRTINGVDDGGGIVVAAGNTFDEFILSDFNKTVGRVPSYARRTAKWYASPTFVDSVMMKLATAAGGITAADIINGPGGMKFLGYPVELTEVLPTTNTNSQIAALFGSLQLSSDFGDRRGVNITFSDTAVVDSVSVFQTDEIAFRATERFDINNHDLGSSTVAGPIVGLMSAAA